MFYWHATIYCRGLAHSWPHWHLDVWQSLPVPFTRQRWLLLTLCCLACLILVSNCSSFSSCIHLFLIVDDLYFFQQISLATAIRYSLTRRAFSTTPNGDEVLLLDYPSHQRRLLPLLAKTSVLHLWTLLGVIFYFFLLAFLSYKSKYS